MKRQGSKRPSRKPSGSRGASSTPRALQKNLALWDQAAAWYDTLVGDQGSDYQQGVVFPGAWKLLGIKPRQTVLDLACGQGVFSRYLHRRGVDVEGVDVSSELIRRASDRSPREIRFHMADAAGANALRGRKFDAVVCLLAIQNMPDLSPVFANVTRWLKPSGKFIFVATHPCFRIPRQTHWGWDEEKKIQYRRIDHYAGSINIPILMPPMTTSKTFTVTHHRSLQTYVRELAGSGLWVDAMEEWVSNRTSQPGNRSRGENRARKEIPLFIAIRARLAKEL